ncbi:MAG: O-antigen ligase [Pseudomonadota bacterium]
MSTVQTLETKSSERAGWVTSLTVLIVVLFSEGLVQRLVAPEIEADGNVILRFMWIPVYAGVIALSLSRIKDILDLALRTPALMALVALAAVSFVWSIEPSLSFRRGISVSMTTLFGLYLAARHDWRELLKLLGGVWIFLALMSFLAGLVAPGFARMQEIHPGTWRGFWFEKNTLGGHMARAAIVFAVLVALDIKRRWFWVCGLALATGLVILTTSKTSLLAILMGVSIITGGLIAQRSPVSAIGMIWLGVTGTALGGGVLYLYPEAFFELIGKDPSLTGRTEIWSALGSAIADRPWLGYGYGAFWAEGSDPADWVRKAVQWDAPTAHNGWLDVCLSVGLVGVALFSISFAMTSFRAVTLMFRHRFGLFVFAMVTTLMLFSLSESIFLEPNNLVWATYVAVAAMLSRGVSPDEGVTRLTALSRPRWCHRRAALEI